MENTPTQSLTCLIVDDEPLAIEVLERYVKKTPSLNLAGTFLSAQEAAVFLANNPVDLLFLDIRMPGLDGLTLSRTLVDKALVIFTTAYQEYAVESYKVEALDYLLKPINYQEFSAAVDKALKRKQTVAGRASLVVTSRYRRIQLPLDDILCIKSQRDYIKIYTVTDDQPIKSLMTLKSAENLLPTQQFCKVHRSYIVNRSRILRMERGRIALGKLSVPISDTFKQSLYEILQNNQNGPIRDNNRVLDRV